MKGNLYLFYLIFAIPLFIYGLEFMIIVETPDMEGDKIAKKKTLVTRLGRNLSYKIIILSLLIVSIYFLFISYLGIFREYLDFSIIYVLSLIPLFVAVYGWFKKPFTKKIAIKTAQKNMNALILFVLVLNMYLIAVTFT